MAVLRNRKFFNLAELNLAIQEALLTLNQKPFQKLEGSRQSKFETLDKPALRELLPDLTSLLTGVKPASTLTLLNISVHFT
jgi:hypothetical protein